MAGYSTYSLSTLLDRLSEKVGNTVFWGESERVDAINEALRVWQVLTGEFTKTVDQPINQNATTGTGSSYWEISKQVVSILKLRATLTSPGTGTTMDNPSMMSVQELDLAFPGWQAISGTIDIIYWAPVGLNMIATYPRVDWGILGLRSGYITMEGYSDAPPLINDGDVIQLNDGAVSVILGYAQHYLSFKEGGDEFKSTIPLLNDFMKAAGVRNTKLVAADFYRVTRGTQRDTAENPEHSSGQKGVRV